ncbi:ATP-NAD kinase [Haladaptatus paucihalophilus DX253]|uniref:ATP-NAD kinase n=1 Tax=Haladaptatus paucihalophilus DX253 TaxID=797209 RepID=E7QPY9_HALPU|nr:ATP-NAD kinase family protein [Haladaptatus paucihalophilus]EFW93053.1 ATP-NAD kinase [Haladaptatus paucihalophilus DX253]SHK43152.1 Predicted polyphosphate-or ATP-dependent NAD kinase [Haladaptatus paucihalophilus DX253]
MRIGVVVNPIAGMGGRVGLKGTDGKVAEARERGAERRAPDRAVAALSALYDRAPDSELLTYAGEMGAEEALAAGFDPEIVGEPGEEETSAADTREAVRRLVADGVDLVLFVGGDGTAVDVAETLAEVEADAPMLGVPAGVKIYSSVFAVTPKAAGRVAASFDRTEEREVNDIDEEAYRAGEVRAELKAVASVPVAESLQSGKQLGGGTVESLAAGVADDVQPGVTYVLGPGSTVGAIKSELGFDGSPLGVDVWRDGEVVARDANEEELLAALGGENVIVVSPIGGQGFVFGRGNHQISPAVIRRSDVEIVASKTKLDGIGVLRADTGDEGVDESLRGWWKVRVGRFERRMLKLS